MNIIILKDNFFSFEPLDSLLLNNVDYKVFISSHVKSSLEKGKITHSAIKSSLLTISLADVITTENEDFLFDCIETDTRLVISKAGNTLRILMASFSDHLPIF